MGRNFGQLELTITRGASGGMVAAFAFRVVSADGRTLHRVGLGRAALRLEEDDPGMSDPYAAVESALTALRSGPAGVSAGASSPPPPEAPAPPGGPRGDTPGGS